ncbi:uncharacterized protein BT62DRAFT_915842 [Guyanagaster necrorhizus]|uniref:Uncharacterized protein n=1 Tax=Guyanagaster necrorhizus TaxID=856835 RepID=A0A9P7W2G3_9AGAR|nr:uncharacterized protein BT62DRAFT_915842 [Guyanagaster necrorhizus MCA 3950]KAG7452101.1 hypothetical protein BT62DRAFT_915842 [Guyanagaster necrorhizus MCA 3950]
MFATGAIVGWPFALALAIPFVFEELFVFGADTVPSASYGSWISTRWKRLFGAVSPMENSLLYPGTLFGITSFQIVDQTYTEPWDFCILNLLLNFSVLTPFASLSLPALATTYAVDRKRLGFTRPSKEESSLFTLLSLRLVPFYLWLSILSKQEYWRNGVNVEPQSNSTVSALPEMPREETVKLALETRYIPKNMNGLNREEPSHYVVTVSQGPVMGHLGPAA